MFLRVGDVTFFNCFNSILDCLKNNVGFGVECMRDMLNIKLSDALLADGFDPRDSWPVDLPSHLGIVLKHLDHEKKKIITIEFQPDNFSDIDYAVRKTGVEYDELDLLLIFRDVESNIDKIVAIYKKWFFDDLDAADISEFIEK